VGIPRFCGHCGKPVGRDGVDGLDVWCHKKCLTPYLVATVQELGEAVEAERQIRRDLEDRISSLEGQFANVVLGGVG